MEFARFGFAVLFLGILLSACAGPTTPFGAIDRLYPESANHSLADAKDARLPPLEPGVKKKKVLISVLPDRQMWHQRSDLSLDIEDLDGVPEQHELSVVFNGVDVTNRFLLGATRTYQDGKRKMHYHFRDLRLRATDRNQIVFHYRRDPKSQTRVFNYQEPICNMDESRSIASVSPFAPEANVLQLIDNWARQKKMNPSFIAGLIAQESGFDEQAVSWAKAIGLTQITDLAAEEIKKSHPDWPQYSSTARMSAPLVKAKVYTGDINSSNDWRLDRDKSIQGGLEYIAYLQAYWQQPDNLELLKQNMMERPLLLPDVILASYNSGAARVKRRLQLHGRRWLEGEDMLEARRYVGKIRSFCYHFKSDPAFVAEVGGLYE